MNFYFRLSIILFLLYLAQYLFIDIEFINELQNEENYKLWSGLLLFSFLAFQWGLTFARSILKLTGNAKELLIKSHKWVGALSPIAFYLHSAKPDHGLLFFLTLIFFLNAVIGLFSKDVISTHSLSSYRIWLFGHIVCSSVVLFVSILHIWIVFYYN